MSQKKSYMSNKNILTEDFFTNMARIGAVIRGLKKSKDKNKEAPTKDTDVKKAMKGLNSSVSKLEKYYSKLYGKTLKLDRFKLKDFI
tara:strand:- start:384 stop:644 length:261 start_codon:yes stop_codon:yes gene_type:complete